MFALIRRNINKSRKPTYADSIPLYIISLVIHHQNDFFFLKRQNTKTQIKLSVKNETSLEAEIDPKIEQFHCEYLYLMLFFSSYFAIKSSESNRDSCYRKGNFTQIENASILAGVSFQRFKGSITIDTIYSLTAAMIQYLLYVIL